MAPAPAPALRPRGACSEGHLGYSPLLDSHISKRPLNPHSSAVQKQTTLYRCPSSASPSLCPQPALGANGAFVGRRRPPAPYRGARHTKRGLVANLPPPPNPHHTAPPNLHSSAHIHMSYESLTFPFSLSREPFSSRPPAATNGKKHNSPHIHPHTLAPPPLRIHTPQPASPLHASVPFPGRYRCAAQPNPILLLCPVPFLARAKSAP